MKHMASRVLAILPDGRVITEADVTPFSERVIHAGEVAGWALLTFTVLYIGLHIVVTFF